MNLKKAPFDHRSYEKIASNDCFHIFTFSTLVALQKTEDVLFLKLSEGGQIDLILGQYKPLNIAPFLTPCTSSS